MLHELVNGLMRLSEPKEVGYIPVGTVNDFAFSTGIPRDVPEAAALAVSDKIKTLDLGKFGGRYFSYIAAFGIGTNASYETDQKSKNRWGFLAYASNALKAIELTNLDANCRQMTIRAGDQVLEGRFVFGSVSNSRSIGGLTNLVAKDVALDDGMLDGLFIRLPKNLYEMDRLRNSLMARNFDAECMHFIRAESFDIISEPTTWTLDGEWAGNHTNVTVSTQKLVLNIAMPDEE
jgi:diacylglycerol kinase family enzyme